MDFEKDDFVASIPAPVNGGIKLFRMSTDSAPFSIQRFLRLEWLLVTGYSVGDRDIGPSVISFKASICLFWRPIGTVWLRDTGSTYIYRMAAGYRCCFLTDH